MSLQPLFGLVTQCPLFPVGERVTVWQDQIMVAKETMLTAFSLTERKSNYSSTVSRLKNIIPSIFTAKSKLKLLYLQYTLTKDILQSSIRENEPEKRIIFWRRFLDWLLPILTLICPLCVRVMWNNACCSQGINMRLGWVQGS